MKVYVLHQRRTSRAGLWAGVGFLFVSAFSFPIYSQTVPPTSAGSSSRSSQSSVSAQLQAFKILTRDGKETRVSASSLKPGEVIEYSVTYRNVSARTVRNLQATLPIPAQLELLPSSISPTNVRASLDGKKFASLPLRRVVTAPDGTRKIEVVPLREIRFLRWTIGTLTAGKSAVVKARAKLPTIPN